MGVKHMLLAQENILECCYFKEEKESRNLNIYNTSRNRYNHNYFTRIIGDFSAC